MYSNYDGAFTDSIYDLILEVSSWKDIDGSEYTCNSLLEEVRDEIIKICRNYHLDLSVPEKEYNLGDKISYYVPQGDVTRATIIWIGDEEKYGLLIDDKYTVEYSTMYEIVDNPTNYIHYLQHKIGLNIE